MGGRSPGTSPAPASRAAVQPLFRFVGSVFWFHGFERAKRARNFFIEGETPDHLTGASVSQPQRLPRFVAMSERSERKNFF
jgi:hypothetical protein